jgi:hypothetical protein
VDLFESQRKQNGDFFFFFYVELFIFNCCSNFFPSVCIFLYTGFHVYETQSHICSACIYSLNKENLKITLSYPSIDHKCHLFMFKTKVLPVSKNRKSITFSIKNRYSLDISIYTHFPLEKIA